jgi:putative YpdA family bacillithiol system oxidoreductase
LLLFSVTVVPRYRKARHKEAKAKKKFQELNVTGLNTATSVHPHIDVLKCIGCGSCASVCPEGDIIAVINGKATLVHGAKCIGHGLCAEACPVGAISLVMAPPGRSANLPVLSPKFETSVPGVFIVGELGGMGLIKNAITQGKAAVEEIARRPRAAGGMLDLVVVGAGPAGLGAALAAKKSGLQFVLLDQGDVGGTILQYPRQKIVMTSPVEVPLYGTLRLRETSKESLLETWEEIIRKTKLQIRTYEKVVDIQRAESGFAVVTSKATYPTKQVILALGRRGTPRKLGVPGEELPKVAYRLIDASSYQNRDLLVVGGGDSAVEAAIGLALQKTNRVVLSYRGGEFSRLKSRNVEHLNEQVGRKKIMVILNSNVREIKEQSVTLNTPGGVVELKNDFVFISVGGELPFEFLQRVGIRFHREVIADPESRPVTAA